MTDCEHTYREAIWELTHFEPLLVAGGYLLMQDTLYYDGLGGAVDQLHESGRFESVSFETSRRVDDFNGHGPISAGLTVARNIRSGPSLVVDQRWVERPGGTSCVLGLVPAPLGIHCQDALAISNVAAHGTAAEHVVRASSFKGKLRSWSYGKVYSPR